MGYYIGCDVGGTNIRAAIVNSDSGESFDLTVQPTNAHEGHEMVLARMAALFEELIANSNLRRDQIQGIGIGIPGKVDVKNGITNFITNLPGHWINVPVAGTIQRLMGIPTYILNDVRSITWGELKFGAGRNCSSMVLYAIGTGIGGGIVINNKLLLGNSGQAGEVGHMTIVPDGILCNCGNRGCLEQYASGPAIRSAAIKAVAHGATTILGEMVDFDLNRITPHTVYEAAISGDRIAKDIYYQAGRYLGIAIGNSIVHIEPERVVIGGGVAEAGELLFAPVREELKRIATLAPIENIELVPAELGNNAGVIGVSMWAKHNVMAE